MRFLMITIATFLVAGASIAQANPGSGTNKDIQPLWGPTGYDYVEYYYLPEIETYYHVPQQVFCHYEDGRWIRTVGPPPPYRDQDIYRLYKVVVNEFQPYDNHSKYKSDALITGRHVQQTIRDSRDSRYHFTHSETGYDIPTQQALLFIPAQRSALVKKSNFVDVRDKKD